MSGTGATRSFWGWGNEGAGLGVEERRNLELMLAARLGGPALHPLAPPRLDEIRLSGPRTLIVIKPDGKVPPSELQNFFDYQQEKNNLLVLTGQDSHLADAVEDTLQAALRSQGGRASAKASLKAMDQIRLEMENSGEYSLSRAATRLDERSGATAYSGLADVGGKTEAINTFTRRAGTATTVNQAPGTAGRLLASNCFQCHGTGGVGGFDRIRGSDAAEVRDYLRKPARSDIMAAHAQGYTSAQLDAIIAYLKQ